VADHPRFARLHAAGLAVEGKSDPLGVDDPARGETHTMAATASLGQLDTPTVVARRAVDRGPWRMARPKARATVHVGMADAPAARRAEPIETAILETCPRTLVAQWTQVDMAHEHAQAPPEPFAVLPGQEHDGPPLARSFGPAVRDVALRLDEAAAPPAVIGMYERGSTALPVVWG
jgi:hypothetical protein